MREAGVELKPGMFGSWRECAIKLMLAVLVMACLGAMAVYAVSNIVGGVM
jgi:hypothetical protein